MESLESLESLESAERVAWRAWSSPAPLSLSPPKQSRPIAAAAAAAAGCCCCCKTGGWEEKRQQGEGGGGGGDVLVRDSTAAARPQPLFQGQPLIMARSVLCCRRCVLRSSVARQHRAKAVGQDQDSSSCCAYLFYLSR